MKKVILMVLAMMIFLTSCGNADVEQGATQNDEILTSSAEQTTSFYDPSNFENDPFESFSPFPGNYGTFFGKRDVFDLLLPENLVMIRFKVLSLLGIDQEYNVYEIQITDVYGKDMEYDKNQKYTMYFLGTDTNPLYGRPALEIGEEYARFAGDSFAQYSVMSASLIFKVEDTENETYVYGYGVDLSRVNHAEKITNKEENAIYKIGKHDKILAYLNSIGQEIPVFEYKCEIDVLLNELRKR